MEGRVQTFSKVACCKEINLFASSKVLASTREYKNNPLFVGYFYWLHVVDDVRTYFQNSPFVFIRNF